MKRAILDRLAMNQVNVLRVISCNFVVQLWQNIFQASKVCISLIRMTVMTIIIMKVLRLVYR